MGSLPGGVSVPVEDPATAVATVIDDRSLGTTAVDVEAVSSTTPSAGESVRMKKVEELLAASFLIHEVYDREVHEVGSNEMEISKPEAQENRSAHGWKGPTT